MKNNHSPLAIELMLWAYYSSEPHSRIWNDTIQQEYRKLEFDGVVVQTGTDPITYKATSKGSAWVRMICELPYPNAAYIHPLTNEPVKGWI